MPHFSLRMVIMCLVATVLLNSNSYLIAMFYYNPTGPRVHKYYPKSSSDVEVNGSQLEMTTNILNQHQYLSNGTESASAINGQRMSIKNINVNMSINSSEYCPKSPPGLGPTAVNKRELKLDFVEKQYPQIKHGGRYKPPHCTARHKVATIVPYKDRQQHLAIFLDHMHPFLMKQQIEYGIFIVEQDGNKDFNRAKLMNVGFKESERMEPGGWQCFIFHDIDLLPLDTRNLYSCPRQPRHMSVSIDEFGFMSQYNGLFGGVSAMTKEQFTKVNGFSNKYWGWGGEDDDMSYRLNAMNYTVSRYKMSIARYVILNHNKTVGNPKRFDLLSKTNEVFLEDGLSTLEYELIQVVQHHLYTYILANIDERS